MRRLRVLLVLLIAVWVACFSGRSGAGQGAYYHPTPDRLFWFMLISDTHIGGAGSGDHPQYLTWAVTEARQVITPLFIVNAGDLTDSTNGGAIPNGPYQAEWDAYRQILENAGLDASFYYDLPGNHDHYNDAHFAYYLANSMQGRATGGTQPSWVREFPYGKYHFLGVCTPGNDGAPFSVWPWDNYGDHAGLDDSELAFIQTELAKHADAQLTLIFGHHPFEAHYFVWADTGLTYGLASFLNLLNQFGIPLYAFGHTHNYRENFYTQNLTQGVYYMNVASLGQSAQNHLAVMAVDGNGLSLRPVTKDVWPVVLITAPADRCLGSCANPFAYQVPQGYANPIRALVFDPNPVTQVQFSIDGSGVWQDMQQVSGAPIWQGFWDASAAAPGDHTIQVRAQGTTLASHQITTSVNPALAVNKPLPWLPVLLLAP